MSCFLDFHEIREPPSITKKPKDGSSRVYTRTPITIRESLKLEIWIIVDENPKVDSTFDISEKIKGCSKVRFSWFL